jgi:hypothetical protein
MPVGSVSLGAALQKALYTGGLAPDHSPVQGGKTSVATAHNIATMRQKEADGCDIPAQRSEMQRRGTSPGPAGNGRIHAGSAFQECSNGMYVAAKRRGVKGCRTVCAGRVNRFPIIEQRSQGLHIFRSNSIDQIQLLSPSSMSLPSSSPA